MSGAVLRAAGMDPDQAPDTQPHSAQGVEVPKWTPFNVNEKVRFKLTAFGRQKIAEKDAELNRFITDRGGDPLPPRWTPDAEGWTETQLWCLMEDLGQYCHLGVPQVPFETTIELALAAPPSSASAAVEALREQILEEAAKVCDAREDHWSRWPHRTASLAHQHEACHLAGAIRALKAHGND